MPIHLPKPSLLVAQLAMCVFLTTSCDGVTGFEGHVRDTSGHPIEGAKIVLKSESRVHRELTSAADGSYHILTTNAPFKFQMVLTVTKEGYKPFQKEFAANQDYKHDIVLEQIR